MKEVWKNIPNCEGYQASSKGRIKNLKTKRILNGVNYYGYLRVTIRQNGIKKLFSKHRLIAKTFLPNPNKYSEVNHADGNKQNNCIENLEWCTRKQNAIHSMVNGHQKTKRVGQYDENGNLLKIYFDAYKAEKETNIFHISDCCNGKRKTAGGYYWKYIIKK